MKEYSVIIKQLTTEQKAKLIAAAGGWNRIKAGDIDVSGLTFSDGAYGLAIRAGYKHYGAPTTRFPSPLNMARSWNLPLAANVANCIGNEAHSLGINALATPSAGVITIPYKDSNSSRFSEDPYLSGKMISAYIRGFEHNKVMAHARYTDAREDFAAGSDEKTLREIGLMPYEMAVKEGKPTMINIPEATIDGANVCESGFFTSGVLRTEWQYGGVITAEDRGGVDTAKAMSRGVSMFLSADAEAESQKIGRALARYKKLLDEVAAGTLSFSALKRMVEDGEAISDEEVDLALERLFAAADAAKKKTDISGDSYSSFPCNHPVVFDEQRHNTCAYDAACETVVLLKNREKTLPIAHDMKVAFVGEYVDTVLTELGKGTGIIPMENDVTSKIFGKSGLNVIGSSTGYSNIVGADNELLAENACALARTADVVVAYVGTLGLDGAYALPEHQLRMLRRLRAETSARIVAVVLAGSMIDMSWNDICDAVLFAGDAGQGGAKAVLKILSGAVNPSGKLTESVCDMPMGAGSVEGLHGYRLYQARNVEERYPFGFGLSYTDFEYSDLSVTRDGVRFKLTNTGAVAGAETAQLYIGRNGSAVTAASKELKGFKKVYLEVGESRYVDIPFDSKAFRYYNVNTGRWECEGGIYQIYVASSSRYLILFEEYEVAGSGAQIPATAVADNTVKDSKTKVKVSVKALVRSLISGAMIILFGILAVAYMTSFRDTVLRAVGIRPSSSTASVVDGVLLVVWLAVTVLLVWLLIGGIEKLRGAKKPATLAVSDVQTANRNHIPDISYPNDWEEIEFYTDTEEKEREDSYDGYEYTASPAPAAKTEAEKAEEPVPVRKSVEGRFVKAVHAANETAQLDIAKVFEAVRAYVEKKGIVVPEEQLCRLISAMAASRTLVVRSGSSAIAEAVVGAVAECLDATFTSVKADRTDERITDKLLSPNGSESVASAVSAARSAPDRMSVVFIGGADTADITEYFGEVMRYTGNTASDYVLTSQRFPGKTVVLPANMWFVAAVDKSLAVCCGNACVVDLNADIGGMDSAGEEMVNLDIYTMPARLLADKVGEAREGNYLAEKYWRRIDRVEEYMSGRLGFRVSNRTVNSIEKYAAIYMSCGYDAEATVDCALAAFILGALSDNEVKKLNDADESFAELMDQIFGADKDDRSREMLKVKGIR
ncbi:MAG: glycoside hydrolase family 3 C-terminal domain-containing protein [Clostridia bacterium]|nr:glycoside hydrolase family 3 C-terminal domain-containing protein [Clostridia bacterium]